ncbi:hypothetical protein D3C76_850490 [compost metagenome]
MALFVARPYIHWLLQILQQRDGHQAPGVLGGIGAANLRTVTGGIHAADRGPAVFIRSQPPLARRFIEAHTATGQVGQLSFRP